MRTRSLSRACLSLFTVLALVSVAVAQVTTTGRLTGVVTDTQGAVIPKAEVVERLDDDYGPPDKRTPLRHARRPATRAHAAGRADPRRAAHLFHQRPAERLGQHHAGRGQHSGQLPSQLRRILRPDSTEVRRR